MVSFIDHLFSVSTWVELQLPRRYTSGYMHDVISSNVHQKRKYSTQKCVITSQGLNKYLYKETMVHILAFFYLCSLIVDTLQPICLMPMLLCLPCFDGWYPFKLRTKVNFPFLKLQGEISNTFSDLIGKK